MGFFGLWKKKEDLPAQRADSKMGMDLPNIDGMHLDNSGLEGIDMQLPAMPDADSPFNQNNQNIPNSNFNAPSFQMPQNSQGTNPSYMPGLDNDHDEIPAMELEVQDSEIIEPSAPSGGMNIPDLTIETDENSDHSDHYSDSNSDSANQDYNSQLNSQLNAQLSSQQSGGMQYVSSSQIKNSDVGSLDEDMNHLFISDDWKEPDWNNYDAYNEEKIDMPAPEDFGLKSVPSLDDSHHEESHHEIAPLDEHMHDSKYDIKYQSPSIGSIGPVPSFDNPKTDYNNFSQPSEPGRQRPASAKPVELYIKGKAYARVFMELDHMNSVLSKIDSKLGNYEEILKREEPLVSNARDQMEHLYKRLNIIDKKIFNN